LAVAALETDKPQKRKKGKLCQGNILMKSEVRDRVAGILKMKAINGIKKAMKAAGEASAVLRARTETTRSGQAGTTKGAGVRNGPAGGRASLVGKNKGINRRAVVTGKKANSAVGAGATLKTGMINAVRQAPAKIGRRTVLKGAMKGATKGEMNTANSRDGKKAGRTTAASAGNIGMNREIEMNRDIGIKRTVTIAAGGVLDAGIKGAMNTGRPPGKMTSIKAKEVGVIVGKSSPIGEAVAASPARTPASAGNSAAGKAGPRPSRVHNSVKIAAAMATARPGSNPAAPAVRVGGGLRR
jgi:hypothetical protein